MYYNILTESVLVLCMGFWSRGVWGMGYCGRMGYHPSFPAYQVGSQNILWDIREYGLPELWVRRVSTVISVPLSGHLISNCLSILI